MSKQRLVLAKLQCGGVQWCRLRLPAAVEDDIVGEGELGRGRSIIWDVGEASESRRGAW